MSSRKDCSREKWFLNRIEIIMRASRHVVVLQKSIYHIAGRGWLDSKSLSVMGCELTIINEFNPIVDYI